MMDKDRIAIREVVENWALWRDAGDWERFRTVWHPDGRMMATWFQGPAEDFIAANQEGFTRGVRILHFLGGSSVDVAGNRAIAQTKMTIAQRATVDGVVCDVVCTGRFYDFFERVAGRWLLVLRQPIYERDRLDPVDPDARVVLRPEILERFPEGYRHLAYLQTSIGMRVKPDMPGLVGPEVEDLYQRGATWLASATTDAPLRHIRGADLSGDTTQTAGMTRLEAIAGKTVGSSKVWMGQTGMAPGTVSGNHHHGEAETAIYVVSGHPVFVFADGDTEHSGSAASHASGPRTVAERRIETEPGDFVFVPPFAPHREENPGTEEAVVVVARSSQEGIVVNLPSLWTSSPG
jgi:uncharacterized RmlC-like cupin family protein